MSIYMNTIRFTARVNLIAAAILFNHGVVNQGFVWLALAYAFWLIGEANEHK